MKSIYIGNLSYTTTSSQLHDLFAQFGEVISSTLIYDNVTKKFKGYAFIEMEDTNAKTAISMLHGSLFLGRTLYVNEAKKNKNHTK